MTRIFVSHPRDKLAHYFGAKASSALEAIANVQYNALDRELTALELAIAAKNCEAIIAYRQTPGTAELFAALPELVAFMRCAMDIRTIDIDAASTHGILITHASAGFVPAVSEWVIGVMVDLGRGISRHTGAYRSDHSLPPLMGRELRGATLGVIGYGRIARYLCDLALAFGMHIVVYDPYVADMPGTVRQVDLASLLAGSDFVVCLAAALPETKHMMNKVAFDTMKPDAFFINASRGELVDESALLDALNGDAIAGCAMDVGQAPDQMPSPLLARHPRVIATPHIGGLTPEAIEHQSLETVAQLKALIHGDLPPGTVNAPHANRLRRWGHAATVSAAV